MALVLYGSLGVGKTVVVARAAAEAKKDLREAGCVVVRAMYQPSVLDQPSNFTLKERYGLRYRTMTFVRSSSLLRLMQRWNKRKNYLSFNDLSKRDRAARIIQKRWRASCV